VRSCGVVDACQARTATDDARPRVDHFDPLFRNAATLLPDDVRNEGNLTVDYREGHLSKGGSYDVRLATEPFDAYMARQEALRLTKIVPRLTQQGARRYLDFACGTGRITATVAPLVDETVGVDISESMLGQARRKCPSARFVCADLTRESRDFGQFDLVTSFRFFGNAQAELRAAALRAIATLLRPGGHLIINNHRNPQAFASLLHRMTGGRDELDLTHRELDRLLREHGIRILELHPIALWVFRAKLQTSPLLESRFADRAERAFGHRAWARFAPDCIVVGQKE
jgi:SAM-dependent methyltransferase